jgi:hypothetical protein
MKQDTQTQVKSVQLQPGWVCSDKKRISVSYLDVPILKTLFTTFDIVEIIGRTE